MEIIIIIGALIAAVVYFKEVRPKVVEKVYKRNREGAITRVTRSWYSGMWYYIEFFDEDTKTWEYSLAIDRFGDYAEFSSNSFQSTERETFLIDDAVRIAADTSLEAFRSSNARKKQSVKDHNANLRARDKSERERISKLIKTK